MREETVSRDERGQVRIRSKIKYKSIGIKHEDT